MKMTTTLIVPFILGLIAAVVVFATLTGKELPLIAGPRPALIALFIIGLAMCTTGGLKEVGASGNWTSPLTILGILLGIVIVVVFVGTLAGWKLPLIEGETQAVIALAIFMGAKYLIGTAGSIFHLL